jgi:hypothetical protein
MTSVGDLWRPEIVRVESYPGRMSEVTPQFNRPRRAKKTPDVLALAADRERVLDEHNYRVQDELPHRGSFRLQLFTVDGVRPVAVATQQWGGDADDPGPSLMNGAETFAAVVWQRHFPAESEPPVWIQLTLEQGRADAADAVTFTIDDTRPYTLEEPDWETLTLDQVAVLVGGELDATRGEHYRPILPEPEPEAYFAVVDVQSLPPSRPTRDPGCMPQQPAPGTYTSRSCCSYHGGDWHRVSEAAIDLVHAAEDAGVDAADLLLWAKEQDLLAGYGLSDWEAMALRSLLAVSVAIYPFENGGGYVNGQHRARAMQDQGVVRTVVVGTRYPDDTQG